jgi:DNA-3-methyladenine glycosylase I
MSWYCDIAPGHPVHGPYHEREYGFPETDETRLFERLALEIMQAGLSWEIVLKKRAGMNAAFHGFAVDKVAAYRARDIERLLADAAIIRNRRKVEAIIENAGRVKALRKSDGGFAAWIEAQHPLAKEDWVKRFRQTFVFMGGEVVGEFLLSIGYLPNAHRDDCPVYRRIARQKPRWMASSKR